MNQIIGKFTAKQATIEELEPNIIDAGESFNDLIFDLWKKLMTIEMQLYEQCEVRFKNEYSVIIYSNIGTYPHFFYYYINKSVLTLEHLRLSY